MTSTQKVVLCTGANQGLGYAIVQVAAQRNPRALYILACRNVAAGHEAAQQLKDEGVTAMTEVIELDVTNDEHIAAAAKHVESKYGKLDVLINNAGVLIRTQDADLPTLRKAYNDMLNINLTSVAVITTALLPLLQKAADPKVINITSGLGSIVNTLTKKMGRYPPYGASKVGLNGLTAHMQTTENDRVTAELAEGKRTDAKFGKVKYYVVAPGVLRTAFTRFADIGKDPKLGAEAVVRLMEGEYPGGTQWEWEGGEMREIPW
ncbi:NAD(P)-binding protein [Glonium stellatum]|uniref:NAD(P)-binding protein n=1 Tax=Glonium stellatum TaxID=574774 RepID=A0A8E2JML4_9PEZI|nr:NAD(P)-binding protein [Glonium stellatum]